MEGKKVCDRGENGLGAFHFLLMILHARRKTRTHAHTVPFHSARPTRTQRKGESRSQAKKDKS
jgi:hypothetical protein